MSILSFMFITQWHYGYIVDGGKEFLYGFPFIYKCRGFHTSLSAQYFVLEAILNFISYFLIWLVISVALNKIWTINIPRKITRIFWISYAVILAGFIYLSNGTDDIYLWKCDFEVEVYDSGFSFLESHPDRESFSHLND